MGNSPLSKKLRNKGNSPSSERKLFKKMLCTLLKGRGITTSKGQISSFVEFIHQVCAWFPEGGTLDVEAWEQLGGCFREHFHAHGPEKTPVDTFSLWLLIKDCLQGNSELDKWKQSTRECSVAPEPWRAGGEAPKPAQVRAPAKARREPVVPRSAKNSFTEAELPHHRVPLWEPGGRGSRAERGERDPPTESPGSRRAEWGGDAQAERGGETGPPTESPNSRRESERSSENQFGAQLLTTGASALGAPKPAHALGRRDSDDVNGGGAFVVEEKNKNSEDDPERPVTYKDIQEILKLLQKGSETPQSKEAGIRQPDSDEVDWSDLAKQAARYNLPQDAFVAAVPEPKKEQELNIDFNFKDLLEMLQAFKKQSKGDKKEDEIDCKPEDPMFPRNSTTPLIARVGFHPNPPSTFTNSISPLQMAMRRAQRDGEVLEGFPSPMQVFPVVIRRGQNENGDMIEWRDYESISYKTLKELKLACAQYGATAPFTIAVMETIANMTLPPGDWKTICKAVLTGGDYLLWITEFFEQCDRHARSEAARRDNITADQLAGAADYNDVNRQLNYPPAAYDYIRWAAVSAWKKLPKSGIRKEELSKIKQGPDEAFQDFVARLLTAAQRIIGDTDAATIVAREMAFENANTACQAAMRPFKGRANLNDYIKLCADIGPGYVQGVTLAAALQGQTFGEFLAVKRGGKRKPGPPGSCYNCGQLGHIAKNCPGGNLRGAVNYKTAKNQTPGLCPRCKRGNHWANECHSRKDKDGNVLPPLGNGKRGQPQAPQQIYGVVTSQIPDPMRESEKQQDSQPKVMDMLKMVKSVKNVIAEQEVMETHQVGSVKPSENEASPQVIQKQRRLLPERKEIPVESVKLTEMAVEPLLTVHSESKSKTKTKSRSRGQARNETSKSRDSSSSSAASSSESRSRNRGHNRDRKHSRSDRKKSTSRSSRSSKESSSSERDRKSDRKDKRH